MIEAEGNRTQAVFYRLFSAIAASDPLEIPMGIPCGIFLALTKNSSVKNAKSLSINNLLRDGLCSIPLG